MGRSSTPLPSILSPGRPCNYSAIQVQISNYLHYYKYAGVTVGE